MTARVGVVLHGADAALADAVVGAVSTGERLGEVRAVEALARDAPVAPVAARLAEVAEVVVGVRTVPVPGLAARHDALRDALDGVPYWAVVTWHGLPAYVEALAAALGAAPARGDRVLLTAPDALLRQLPPEHRVVLRDVAAALHEQVGARPTIAVDRSPPVTPVTPTAVEAVRTLVEVHGAGAVVRCSIVPGDQPDPAVTEVAAGLGVPLTDVTIDRATHVSLLGDVVATLLHRADVAAGPAEEASGADAPGDGRPADGAPG